MKIPPNAIIPASKLTDYLLAPRQWDDKSKFLAQAGFEATDPAALEAAIRRLIGVEEAVEDGTNPYGTFYRIEGLLEGPQSSLASRGLDFVTMEAGRYVPFRDTKTPEAVVMVRPALYDRVALTRDIDEHSLKRGDVATLVDVAPHPSGGPEGMVLEVSNALGEPLRVVIVARDDIEPLQADEVLTVRSLARAG